MWMRCSLFSIHTRYDVFYNTLRFFRCALFGDDEKYYASSCHHHSSSPFSLLLVGRHMRLVHFWHTNYNFYIFYTNNILGSQTSQTYLFVLFVVKNVVGRNWFDGVHNKTIDGWSIDGNDDKEANVYGGANAGGDLNVVRSEHGIIQSATLVVRSNLMA